MPNTDHYILKRSGWLILLFFTHLSASCLRNSFYRDFLIANFENHPPSAYMWAYELACFHCRERSQRWEERAKTEGIKTPFGVFLFKAEHEDEKMAAAIVNGAGGLGVVGGSHGVGALGDFRCGLSLGGGNGVDKLEELGILDSDEEEEDDDEDEDDDEEDDDNEDEDEEHDILLPLLWIND
ncbi:uncharacterized protein EAF01_010005 [Botrytis porri]|uniref:uncharacterized protein n=1 Tax=Botrytis porri TaxID=87229 RepID=UPI0018FF5326|nr:uncharacterized protein EAF01_010005 [Botrytis porri]KAF7894554.1 hypothetical protein EAF01_010005 [Botrytis porri]